MLLLQQQQQQQQQQHKLVLEERDEKINNRYEYSDTRNFKGTIKRITSHNSLTLSGRND